MKPEVKVIIKIDVAKCITAIGYLVMLLMM